jgi:hypothetical protein
MKTSLITLVRSLANSYPNYHPNDETLNIYVSKLKGYPIDQVQDACDKIIETNKFFPSLAELKDLVESMGYNKDQRHPDLFRKIQKNLFDDVSMEVMVAKNYSDCDCITETDIDYIYEKSGTARK